MESKNIKKIKDKYKNLPGILSTKNLIKSNKEFGFNVEQIRKVYNLNKIMYPIENISVHIVIIIAYSNPELQKNFDIFCELNNLPCKKIDIIKVNPKTVSNSDRSSEICIDTQWSYAIFPKAKISVVEAESESLKDLLVAIEIGKTLNPDIINMSWSIPEFNKCNDIDIFNNSKIIFVASSGDDNTVCWPSSNPNVLSIGATSLYVTSDGCYKNETTWEATGCGYSKYFSTPSYQFKSGANITKYRSTVDLSIVGNPETGCYVYDNKYTVIGGTSLSAPIISGILGIITYYRKLNNKVLLNSNEHSYFSIQNLLYDYYGKYGSYIFNDIIIGISGDYKAKIGYDLPTGLGSPKFCLFFDYLTNF